MKNSAEKKVYVIVAVDENNGIGKDGKLPWHFFSEMKYFKKTTLQTNDPNKKNMVIMGRNTWESIQPKYRPLKDRKNVILTSREDLHPENTQIAPLLRRSHWNSQ